MQTCIKDISKYVGEEVTLRGWLYNKRSSGKLAFLEIRDGSGFIQAVASKNDLSEEAWNQIEESTQESSLEIVGKVVKHPKQEGVFELHVTGYTLKASGNEFPITKKEHGPDFLLEHRHLWLRSKKQWAILRIRDVVESAINEYLHNQNFVRTDSPIFTPNACEGTTTLFGVPYFELGEAYLSQSGQLYLEALIGSVGRCYDFGPTFRAEKSVTKRHLTEFWMMDAEAAFVEHDENMDIQEGLVKHIINRCLEKCTKEFEVLERDVEPLKKVVEKPFTRLSYEETIKRLQELGSDIKFGEDLGNDDEGLLTKDSDVPIFIEKWPKTIKPFYMKLNPHDPAHVLNNDLIATEGAGEIIGGSQREDDYELLRSRILEEGLSVEEYGWYLDTRKYGSVLHSGFGMGVERMVRWMAGIEHIRECIPFPRLVNRVKP
ncbi:MAG: asparagine--tRNA ligase [Candidatus Magasanikbacteria bacterium]